MAISAAVRAVYNAYVKLAQEATDPNEQEKFYQFAYDSLQEGFVPPVENSPVPPQVAAAAAPPVRESTDALRRRLGLIPLGSDIGRQEDEPGLEPVDPDLDFYDWLSGQHKQSIVDKVSLPVHLQSIVDEGKPTVSLKDAALSVATTPNPLGLLVSGGIAAFRHASALKDFNYAERAIALDKNIDAQRANTIGDVTGINDPETLAKIGLGGATTPSIYDRPTTGPAYSTSGDVPPLTDVQKAAPYFDTTNLFSDLRNQISGLPTLGDKTLVPNNIVDMLTRSIPERKDVVSLNPNGLFNITPDNREYLLDNTTTSGGPGEDKEILETETVTTFPKTRVPGRDIERVLGIQDKYETIFEDQRKLRGGGPGGLI
tara:strand:+ start:61 stop:1176 length:1116 start_codon:yes stop_codon:yes gene_type:complete